MVGLAKKRVLPLATLTQIAEKGEHGATKVALNTPGEGVINYYTIPLLDSETKTRRDGKPNWVAGTYRLMPLVLNGDGSPWAEANVWLVHRLESSNLPNMLTYASLADDLAAFRRFIDSENIDWLSFSAHKLRRPTYRYNASLRLAVTAGEIAIGTAKRRMATVVRFYRWLIDSAGFAPEHAPWVDKDVYVDFADGIGFRKSKKVKTTDVAISVPVSEDAWDDHIIDDGRLRPLPEDEQRILMTALASIDNTEMSLIHVFAMQTGARIQTTLTLRVRHFSRPPSEIPGLEYRLRAGPGTGVDTKKNKKGFLRVPKWLYERLYTYAHSERARKRRSRANGGDHPNQLLFLSIRGAALYETREMRDFGFHGPQDARHAITGGAVRQFIYEKLLPEMRRALANPNYEFSFHDLRATFGMNTANYLLELVKKGDMTYAQAFNRLRTIMWHSRLEQTEAYLNYDKIREEAQKAQEDWNQHLTSLAQQAVKFVSQ